MPGQPRPQGALDVIDLAHPVKLVPGKVEQHENGGVDGIGHMRHVHLVNFERGQ